MSTYRFAPSNTSAKAGLHAGGLRTLLFNYALARKSKKKFFLRCENTDLERSNEQCLIKIIDELDWCGIKLDAGFKLVKGKLKQFDSTKKKLGPFYQTERKEIHDKYINILLEKNLAYEKDGAIFFVMPKEEMTIIDGIVGESTLSRRECQDFVIRKSNGVCSFIFGNYIDDMTQGVQTVVRGIEHLPGVFKQTALAKALGFEPIQYYSIPIVLNADKSKMSKRDENVMVNVEDFRKEGYLPQVLISYIVRIGWSMKNDNGQHLSLDDFIDQFSLNDVVSSNGCFDYKKLSNMNSNYLREMSREDFSQTLRTYGEKFYPDIVTKLDAEDKWDTFVKMYLGRSKTLKDAFVSSEWFIGQFAMDQEAYKKISQNADMERILDEVYSELIKLEDWTAPTLEKLLVDKAASMNLKMNSLCGPIRLALSGGLVSPPLHLTLEALGKDKSMERIDSLLGMAV